MKQIFDKIVSCMLLSAVCLTVGLCLGSCDKAELTDGDKFMLFYPDVTDIGPSYSMDIWPTYHGAKPEEFQVYKVTLDGEAYQTEAFKIDAASGMFSIRSTSSMPVGCYAISISCVSAGKEYRYPDMIKVNMMKPVPEGIVVEPAEITLMMSQVNNVGSAEVLPSAQVTTDGNHVSITSYRIANVRRDGNVMADWNSFFAIDEKIGRITILKNQNFAAGQYVIDLRLTTEVVGADSEDGIFAQALKVDIVSPPVSLEYEPKIKRVEVGNNFVSLPPVYMASSKNLEFTLKNVYPQDAPVTIDPSTGVITLAGENNLNVGDQVQVSVSMKNEYGEKDFYQALMIDIIAFLHPIEKFSYNDSTVWHSTEVFMKPVEVDGDDIKFSFVNLPEELSALSIDENTGLISTSKGNKMPKGEYVITVKVSNDKNEMTDDIAFNIIDNPYFFTKVTWGNNLGLTPVADYASQYRIKDSNALTISVDKENSDIRNWDNISFEILDGTKNNKNLDYATIDATTGSIAVNTSKIGTAIARKRVHMVVVKIISGAGTSGETVKKVPVFFDFNAPRELASNADAPVYTIEYTPFAIQCNPMTGGIFPGPEIRDETGSLISMEERANINMTYMRNACYYNLNGPDNHVSGIPSVDGSFLTALWRTYYKASGASVPALDKLNNVMPLCYILAKDAAKPHLLAYLQNDLQLYVKGSAWKDADGNYANGVFEAQVVMGYPYKNDRTKPGYVVDASTNKGKDPYQLYPFLIWFDTEF